MTGLLTLKLQRADRVGGHDPYMDQLDQLFTPEQLSEYLEIPVATLYSWRHRGLGPVSFRAGKHLRYRRNDVAQWIGRQLEVAGVLGRETATANPAGGARG